MKSYQPCAELARSPWTQIMKRNPLVAGVPQDSLRIRDVARVELIGAIALMSELRVQGAVSQSRKRWLLSWKPEKRGSQSPSTTPPSPCLSLPSVCPDTTESAQTPLSLHVPSYNRTNSLPLTAILIILFFKNKNKKQKETLLFLF